MNYDDHAHDLSSVLNDQSAPVGAGHCNGVGMMFGYYLGCIVLGVTTGLLVGMSSSPVVQYVLPLLFALIGGSAGLFAIKASVTAKATEAKLAIAGWTSVSLTLPFLIFMLYGSVVRTGADLSSLIPVWKNTPPDPTLSAANVAALPSDSAVTILLTNRALANAGIPDADRKAVVKKMIDGRLAADEKFRAVGESIGKVSHATVARLNEIMSGQNEIAADSAFQSALFEFQELDRTFSTPATQPAAREEVARKAEEKLTGTFSGDFVQYLKTDIGLANQIDESLTLIRSLPSSDILTGATKTDLFGLAKAAATTAQVTNGHLPSVANNPLPVQFEEWLQRNKDNSG